MVPVGIELLVQRLKYYQAMIIYPDEHKQVIAAIFGKARFETNDTIDAEGKLTEHASVYAKQFVADIDKAAEIVEDIKCFWEQNVKTLFTDEYESEKFMAVDFKVIRASFNASKVPPPGISEYINESDDEEAEQIKLYKCRLKNELGTECGIMFSTKRALATHARFATEEGGEHGVLSKINDAVITNQCPYCLSTFASRLLAQRHTQRA